MKSKDYEIQTGELAERVVRETEALRGSDILVGRLEGRSGFKHQIDFAIRLPCGRILLYECKMHKRRVGVSDVLVLASRVDDIRGFLSGAIEGILVANGGYTAGAMKVAAHYKIRTDVVDSLGSYQFSVGNFSHGRFKEKILARDLFGDEYTYGRSA